MYIACRQCGLARTLDEIAAASEGSGKDIARCYRLLAQKLNIFIPHIEPDQYVAKFANHLVLQGIVEDLANRILDTARRLRLTGGRGPTGMAAAAVYMASVIFGERRTQREVAEVAEVTEVTIRNRYKELAELLLFVVTL